MKRQYASSGKPNGTSRRDRQISLAASQPAKILTSTAPFVFWANLLLPERVEKLEWDADLFHRLMETQLALIEASGGPHKLFKAAEEAGFIEVTPAF